MRLTPVAVAAHDLVLAYGTTVAIDRSTFAIPRGGITAMIGPNGSGKSTMLAAIAGLVAPVSGTIVTEPIEGVEQRISFVLQSTKVNETLPVTVGEVVAMGRYASTGPHRRLRDLDMAAIERSMARMGISDLSGRHLSQLSGGQRQRVLVAQGLAQEHDMLLLDEPVTGLDLTSAQAIDDVIHDERQTGCTIVITTHDLAEAQVADHVILLSGRVIAAGAPEEVLTLEHLTAAYGPNLLHVEGERLFLDDPAHRPVPGRHVHRERSG